MGAPFNGAGTVSMYLKHLREINARTINQVFLQSFVVIILKKCTPVETILVISEGKIPKGDCKRWRNLRDFTNFSQNTKVIKVMT